MTPEHKQIVQNTWEQIAPIADTAAELFYGRLFELDPMLRQLFASTNMEAQGKKLMECSQWLSKGSTIWINSSPLWRLLISF